MAAPRRTLLAILLVALCAATAVLAAPIQTYAVANVKTTSCSTTLMLKAVGGTSQYGPDISPVAVTATYITADTLEVRIFDPTNSRWEVPEVFVPRPDGCFTGNVQITFTFIENPFSFAVARVNGGSVLFNSSTSPSSPFNGLIFEDQYLELSTQLPSGYHLYGLGEEVLPLLRNYSANPIATLWARDQGTPVGTNLYGSHPFYMEMRPPGLAHGVFLLNSNGMDVALNATSLTYRVIGGVLDLFFFAGPTPLAVTQQYHALIGRPKMPPYWGLGWHQCRWGYPNLETVEQVVANYSAAGIPLETMWTDIDYMDNFLDFTTSPTNYPTPNMTAFVQGLHAKHQHYVVIVDPGIHNITGYPAYDQGIAQDVFLHSADGSVYIGHVWPGSTAFPDWLAPNTSAWWANQIAAFRAAVPVDGLWIDMNEISNFCNGDCATGRLKRTNTRKGLGFDPNNPPYAINNGNDYNPLDTKTVPMDLTHRLDGTTTVEYNIHSLFGLSEQMLTCAALEAQTNQRCFVISRSTYPSSGTHGGHWLGDNVSTWADLYYSIPGTLNMQLYGIPLVGADVCGFGGVTTEELCGRWMQLGSLYPFSRNHNSFGEPSQEPYVWPSVANVSRFALAVKYSLLPYYYTQFYNASTSGGAMVWRPVFFVLPTDANTWAIDQQFMIGDGILATPVLTQGASTVVGYFPPSARWFDFYTHVQLSVPASGFVTLPAPYGAPLPLHIRGGAILPMQGAAYTTTASRLLPFSFIVALDANGAASGGVYVDDGASINVGTNFTLLAATAASSAKGGSVYFNGQRGYTGLLSVNQITVLGLGAAPKTAAVNSVPIPASAIAWNQAASSATFAFLTSFNALASLTWTS